MGDLIIRKTNSSGDQLYIESVTTDPTITYNNISKTLTQNTNTSMSCANMLMCDNIIAGSKTINCNGKIMPYDLYFEHKQTYATLTIYLVDKDDESSYTGATGYAKFYIPIGVKISEYLTEYTKENGHALNSYEGGTWPGTGGTPPYNQSWLSVITNNESTGKSSFTDYCTCFIGQIYTSYTSSNGFCYHGTDFYDTVLTGDTAYTYSKTWSSFGKDLQELYYWYRT